MIRRVALISLALLLSIAAGAAIWLWWSQPVLYSNPAAPRTNLSYDRLFRPPSKIPPLSSNVLAALEMRMFSSNTVRIPFNAPSVPDDAEYFPHELRIAESNQVILGEGNLKLEQIGVAYATTPTNFDYSVSLPPRYFSAQGEELSKENARPMENFEERLDFQGNFPSVRFYFSASNLPPIKSVGFQAFDQRTKISLNAVGHSVSLVQVSSNQTYFAYGCNLRLWHQSPIELILTLCLEPQEILEMDPDLGAELHFTGGIAKLLWMTDGTMGSTRIESVNSTNYFRLEKGGSSPDKSPHSSLAFLIWPKATGAPIEFEFLLKDDRKLGTGSQTSMGALHRVSGSFAVNEIRKIRLKYYPRVHRLVFTIPGLPGLPGENGNVTNLFDTRIPYIRFQSETDMRNDLGQLIAMDIPSEPMSFTNGSFPLVRTNITTREIFEEWSRYRSNQVDHLVIDGTTYTVTVKKSPLRLLFDRIKKMIPGI